MRGEKALCTFPRNDYEPDVVFFGPAKAALIEPATMKFPIPDFICEVLSPSTELYDRGVKFRDFEAHAVSEYWLIDPERETVEQYLPRDGSYELALKSVVVRSRAASYLAFAFRFARCMTIRKTSASCARCSRKATPRARRARASRCSPQQAFREGGPAIRRAARGLRRLFVSP